MADQFSVDLLTKIGYPDLVEQFKDDGVGKEVIVENALTDAYLSKFFPILGKRLLFLARIKKELSGNASTCPNESPVNDGVTADGSDSDDLDDDDGDDLSNVASTSSSEVPAKRRRVRLTDKPQATFAERRSNDDRVNRAIRDLDVRKLLTEGNHCQLEKAIVCSYESVERANKHLNDKSRKTIVRFIANHLLAISLDIKNEHFKTVAEKIVSVFPSEKVAYYFMSPVETGRGISSGKLVTKYRNFKSKLREANASEVPVPPASHVLIQPNTDPYQHILEYKESEEEAKSRRAAEEFLNFQREPFPQVLECWSKTAMLRLQKLLIESRLRASLNKRGSNRAPSNRAPTAESSKSAATPEAQVVNTVHQYYTKWTILGHPSGIQLLRSDFKFMWPQKDGLLYANWAEFENKFLTYASEVVTDTFALRLLEALLGDELTKDQRVAHVLYLLPSVCKPEVRITLPGKKTVTKVSVADCRDSCVLLVPALSDLRTAIKRRAEKLLYQKTSSQPLIVFVGQSLTTIKSHHVNVDKILYSVTNSISALDACFQAFYALHAEYPRDCAHIWLIIQRCLYNIETMYDDMSIGNVQIAIDRMKPN